MARAPADDATRAIDRRALVTRHNVTRTACDAWVPLQVGNGHFAMGVDITGLQSLVPFGCLSHWGWHECPVPDGVDLLAYRGRRWSMHGREIHLPDVDPDAPDATRWLIENPTRVNLGRLGLLVDGQALVAADLTQCRQTLDLWAGTVVSDFHYRGTPVHVITCGDPRQDTVAVRVVSPLLLTGRLAVFIDFPYGDRREFAPYVGNWAVPRRHDTSVRRSRACALTLCRTLDATRYEVSIAWEGTAHVIEPTRRAIARPLSILCARSGPHDITPRLQQAVQDDTLAIVADRRLLRAGGDGEPLQLDYLLGDERGACVVPAGSECRLGDDAFWHRYVLRIDGGSQLDLTCTFSPAPSAEREPCVAEVLQASAAHWPRFWTSGGAIDLSGSDDERAAELERRIVLSQWVMAVNEASSLPPQESGLVNNGWHGKFHFEMLLWHAAHWALWQRWPILHRTLACYADLLPGAIARAAAEGFRGARWPKCTGPAGRETPHEMHALLVWQQPHACFFAELDYRAHPTRETLRWWAPIVEATGEFLASFAAWDAPSTRYVLGPPLHLVSENTDPRRTQNPAFELTYWRFGLTVAQAWRERRGEPRQAQWDHVLRHLARPPVQDGCYVTHEGVERMWTDMTFEHPAIAGMYGLLPGDGVDIDVMRRTADRLFTAWQYERIWGWDFPMLAMCAARLGDPQRAVDLLLSSSSRFQFTDAGLATGGPFPYFPSNGGFLYAVAMMCAGWSGCGDRPTPGFPARGWRVRWEQLSAAL